MWPMRRQLCDIFAIVCERMRHRLLSKSAGILINENNLFLKRIENSAGWWEVLSQLNCWKSQFWKLILYCTVTESFSCWSAGSLFRSCHRMSCLLSCHSSYSENILIIWLKSVLSTTMFSHWTSNGTLDISDTTAFWKQKAIGLNKGGDIHKYGLENKIEIISKCSPVWLTVDVLKKHLHRL